MWCKASFTRELARDLMQVTREDEDDGNRRVTRSSSRGRSLPVGCSLASKKTNYLRGGHKLCRIAINRGRWNGKEFPVIKTEYSKSKCSWGCGATTRTFCRCDFNLMLCNQCYGEHVASLNVNNFSHN